VPIRTPQFPQGIVNGAVHSIMHGAHSQFSLHVCMPRPDGQVRV
jgi:hypothetical protein